MKPARTDRMAICGLIAVLVLVLLWAASGPSDEPPPLPLREAR